MSETTGTPPFSEPTRGFGPVENADETRQAQHTQANDTPTDVNCNAALARAQASSYALLQSNFEANADRRNKMFDQLAVNAMAKP